MMLNRCVPGLLLISILYVLNVQVGHSNGFQIKTLFKNFKMTSGQKLLGYVISSSTVLLRGECAFRCTQDDTCISYNIFKKNCDQICELNSNGLVDTLVLDATSTYYGLY